ncbi:MAG TPA: hypothetical protein VKQ05_05770 [Gemmatimonadales bacterium]|nr:hypothetical protein [Gemmatimonadales bacterium]
MGIWNSTLVYVGARTLLAGAMVALLLRRQVGAWYAGGQVVSDLACAAFLLAYVNPDIRDDVGALVIPLLLFVLYWEATRFLENRRVAAEREDQETTLDMAVHIYGSLWAFGFVVPAMLAGGFLVFNLLAPDQWPFPNPRPALTCAPKRVHAGTELTLRMQVPHGAELTVFTPKGRALTVVPFVPRRSQAPGSGFGWTAHFALGVDTVAGTASAGSQPERVFTDSGVYMLSVSSEAELSSLTCRVRYAGGS